MEGKSGVRFCTGTFWVGLGIRALDCRSTMIRLMLVGLVKPPILVLFRTLIMLWLRVSLRSWNSFKVNVLGLERLLNIGTLVSRVLLRFSFNVCKAAVNQNWSDEQVADCMVSKIHQHVGWSAKPAGVNRQSFYGQKVPEYKLSN